MSDGDYEMRLKAGRNDPCPCGSGEKYKKCHLAEDEAARTATRKDLEEEATERAEAAKDAADDDDQADTKGADKGTGSTRRPKKQFGSKGRGPDGKPKDFPRRGIV